VVDEGPVVRPRAVDARPGWSADLDIAIGERSQVFGPQRTATEDGGGNGAAVTQRKDLGDQGWRDEVGGLGFPHASSGWVLAEIVKCPGGAAALVELGEVTGVDAPVVGMHCADGDDGGGGRHEAPFVRRPERSR